MTPLNFSASARSHLGAFLLVLLCVATSLGLCAWFAGNFDPAFFGAWPEAPVLLAIRNALPAAIVALLFLGITGRPVLSLWSTVLLFSALYKANQLKLLVLDTPLMPGDFLLFGHLGDGGSLLMHYVPHGPRFMVTIATVIGVTIFLLVKERVPSVLTAAARSVVLVFALGLGSSLVIDATPWKYVYATEPADFVTWAPTVSARNMGMLANLMRFGWSTRGPLPKPDMGAADALMQRHRDVLKPIPVAGPLPDIVILQSESFFDPARLRGIELADVLPNYRRLQRLAVFSGNLRVPTYGGGTIRTEYEVLTGIAMRYFPQVQYPYFQLTPKGSKSLASVLKAHGYRTLAVHPHSRAFWNRASAFANMGFDTFDALEQFDPTTERQGFYISDAALVEHILRRLDETSTSPTFVFAISMENHGPYGDYPNVDKARRDAQHVPASLAPDAASDLRGYLYHLQNADAALGRLVNVLMHRKRRTILLFYGDHLPSMPDVYAQVGFDDGKDGPQEPVPWLLLDSANPGPGILIDSASFYLPALTLAVSGIEDKPYFRLLDALRREDAPQDGWQPREDQGLGAVMRLRQERKFVDALKALPARIPSAVAAGNSQPAATSALR